MSQLMTPDQIAEAQRMAREWLAKHQQSGAEVTETLFDVCFTLISGSRETPAALPLCAISGSRETPVALPLCAKSGSR